MKIFIVPVIMLTNGINAALAEPKTLKFPFHDVLVFSTLEDAVFYSDILKSNDRIAAQRFHDDKATSTGSIFKAGESMVVRKEGFFPGKGHMMCLSMVGRYECGWAPLVAVYTQKP